MPQKPSKLTIRAYNVGFGDCFLLSWQYATTSRHILIDFGSLSHPDNSPTKLKEKIANHIKATCGGQLQAVVLTHRHRDHMSGFATNTSHTGPGDIIASLNPKRIVQPWTEHPNASATADEAPTVFALASPKRFKPGRHAITDDLAAHVAGEIDERMLTWKLPAARKLLQSAGHEIRLSLSNQNEISSLRAMAQKAGPQGGAYVSAGQNPGLASLLPGVKVKVLGPPSIKQAAAEQLNIKKYADTSDEYWMHLRTTQRFVTNRAGRRRPRGAVSGNRAPAYARWLVAKLRLQRAEHLQSIVEALDSFLNNTSLILLFEAGTKKFLFPGDAQIENWEYARKKFLDKLPGVNLYKVGHHGSRNATPKWLWNQFTHTGGPGTANRIVSLLSSKAGSFDEVHEVPRQTLVNELKANSDYRTTLGAPPVVEPVILEFDL